MSIPYALFRSGRRAQKDRPSRATATAYAFTLPPEKPYASMARTKHLHADAYQDSANPLKSGRESP
ncbi:MAG: hypothetical protein ACK56F_27745 [bacterium]